MSTPSAPVALAAGDAMPAASVGPITRTDIVRYAGAGGDFNPIHHDEPFAVSLGLPGVFAMGMLQGGALAQRLAAWVGPEHVRTFNLRFTGQVWPGDVLAIEGTVSGVADGIAQLTLTATRQTGDVVLKATASATAAPADS
ncbi:hypothetical protein DSM112329_01135 [Paraconexibacter sp. AEG42_29]|uniref:MaoC-like domain-containing protein n=1 Tax=Paraconexibacter sp. AEG42_29 TaxID=2997339 RepID=A0AAU7ARL9_9ACTN